MGVRLGYGDSSSLTELNAKIIRNEMIEWITDTKYLIGFSSSVLLSSGGSKVPTDGTFRLGARSNPIELGSKSAALNQLVSQMETEKLSWI